MNKTTNGYTVTISTTSLEDQLSEKSVSYERTLTRAQKALKITIDDTKRLRNAQGQLVEGLSLAQIKAGQYVDEQGRIHLADDRFVADLSKIELVLGMYADASGKVFTRERAFVRAPSKRVSQKPVES